MNNSRRDFLKKSGGCALGMAALATQMHHLGIMSAFAQKTIEAEGDGAPYKALVCLYMGGGCDGNNVIVPKHGSSTVSNYTSYTNARATQGLAIPLDQLLSIGVPRMGGLEYGLHPAFGLQAGGNDGIHPLWASGDIAAVVNVGTLVRPMLRSEYQTNSVQRPYQLFSHSDQVAQSQSANSATPTFTGWGGRMSDRMTTSGPLIPMITSIRGAQLFTAGQTTLPIAIADSNTALSAVLQPAGYNGNAMSNARLAAFNAIRQNDIAASSSNYVKAAAGVTEAAMDANALLQTWQEVTATFPNTDLGRQLKQVARMIKKRTDLNVTRQIFYVQVGGSFDHHSNQITGQQTLLSQLSQAMRAFWDELGVQGLQDAVTTFTLSDFNRTLNPAGTGAAVGSDHAWGNHMLVMGGSVNGGDFYGSRRKDGSGEYFPTLVQGGPDDTDGGSSPRGRWIPTTSTEQYVARLARWFGLPQDATTLESVFPNLDNFPTTHEALDFMAP